MFVNKENFYMNDNESIINFIKKVDLLYSTQNVCNPKPRHLLIHVTSIPLKLNEFNHRVVY